MPTDSRLFGLYRHAGVCGKKSDTAEFQDKLTGVLIGLARTTEGTESLVNEATDKLMIEELFTTFTNVNFNNKAISALIEKVEAEKEYNHHPKSDFLLIAC